MSSTYNTFSIGPLTGDRIAPGSWRVLDTRTNQHVSRTVSSMGECLTLARQIRDAELSQGEV